MRLLSGLGLLVGLGSSAGSTSALAHHVADNKTPSTWLEGLLSGIAHPVMELDHLVFVLAMALVMTFVERGWRVVVIFGAALVLGVVDRIVAANLPIAEILVALSVLAAGAALVTHRLGDTRLWMGLAGAAGVVHGYALGGAIIGATVGTMVWYMIGLVLAIGLIVLPVKAITEMLLIEDRTEGLKVRAAGGAVTALGMYFLAIAIAA